MGLLDQFKKLFKSQQHTHQPATKHQQLLPGTVFVSNSTRIEAQCDNGVYVDCNSDALRSIMKEYGYKPAGDAPCANPTASLAQIACGTEYYTADDDDTDYIFLRQCHVQQASIPPFILGNMTLEIGQACSAAQKTHEASALKADEILGGVLGGVAFIAAIIGCMYYRRHRLATANNSPQTHSRISLLTSRRSVLRGANAAVAGETSYQSTLSN